MSYDVFADQLADWGGPVVEVARFLERPQRYLDMAQFRDVAVELAASRFFILSESRFEDLIVFGNHPLAWLIDISSYPSHSTQQGITREDLEGLIRHWCGCITDQTGRPHIVLDAWMYDQFRQKQPRGASAAIQVLSPNDQSNPGHPAAPRTATSASIVCLETYRKTGMHQPPRCQTI